MANQSISDKSWDRYKNIISQFIDNDIGKQPITWKRAITQPLEYGEDSQEPYYPDITLEVLVGYNYMRQWPLSRPTTTGELDNQNCVIWVSASKLKELGYLNSHDYWDMDPSLDRFIISGKLYKTSGDTQVAQAKDKSLLFMVILKREEDKEID